MGLFYPTDEATVVESGAADDNARAPGGQDILPTTEQGTLFTGVIL